MALQKSLKGVCNDIILQVTQLTSSNYTLECPITTKHEEIICL